MSGIKYGNFTCPNNVIDKIPIINSEDACKKYNKQGTFINFMNSNLYLLYQDENELKQRTNIIYDAYQRNKSDVVINTSNIAIYATLPEKLMPAAYIPFFQSAGSEAAQANYNLLTLDDNIPDDYIRRTYYAFPDNSTDIDYMINKKKLKDGLRDLLHDQIKNLNDPVKTYNNFSLRTMIIFVCILWFIIIITFLKIIHYYYSEYYSIIIIILTILMLVSAVVWKMSNILR